MITVDDFIVFCRRTIGSFVTAVGQLDDEQVNRAPNLPGANTPFQITVHAMGAARWWTEHIVCGHPSSRDRTGEFAAAGTVADAVETAEHTMAMLEQLRPELESATSLANEARTSDPLDADWTVGAALIHAYEELAQHLGHLQITVDLVRTQDGQRT